VHGLEGDVALDVVNLEMLFSVVAAQEAAVRLLRVLAVQRLEVGIRGDPLAVILFLCTERKGGAGQRSVTCR
jgi:hypothetical protein